MKVKKERTYSRLTLEAIALLGKSIELARKEKKWSERDLAQRAGINHMTLRKIEKGELSIAIGLVFEVASVVGVKLFDVGPSRFGLAEHLNDKIALLPKRIKSPKKVTVNDDF